MLDDKSVNIKIDTVQVFVDSAGEHGNTLGIVSETSTLSDSECLQIARGTAFSETVFIDDPATGSIRIFTPARQIDFAGHPTVGAAWFLQHSGFSVSELHTPAGIVTASANPDGASVQAPARWSTPWALLPHPTPADVDAASSEGANRHDYAWAWIDQRAGYVRARAFTSASGTVEDEATGSAAMWLADSLNRPLEIRQGLGSILSVVPQGVGVVELSGQVRLGTSLSIQI